MRVWSFGPLRVDPDAREVLREEQPVALNSTEFELLTTLVAHADRAVSSEELQRAVWDTEWVENSSILHVHISRLRSKLGESGNAQRRIVTVHGYGYRFISNAKGRESASRDGESPLSMDTATLPVHVLVARDRRMVWVSELFENLLGWHPDDVLGTYVYDMVHPDDREDFMALRAELDAGYPVGFRTRMKTRSGDFRTIDGLVRPVVGTMGVPEGFLGEWRAAVQDPVPPHPDASPIHLTSG